MTGRHDTAERLATRSKLSFGFGLVLLLFLGETVVAHQVVPNAASPLVWALLGGGAVVCFGLAAWWRAQLRRR